ncbi:MAG: hypothetical protein Cons2KO_10160 [Congregibacter sp.]
MLDTLYGLYSHNISGLLTGLGLLVLGIVMARLLNGGFRAVAYAFVAIALVLSVGGASHLYRQSLVKKALPPPGVLVDVGGYRVHVLAEGPATPTPVVWLGGGHAGGLVMHHLHRLVRDDMRSILVDRPGSGWSDTGPFPRKTRLEVDEVVRALEAAGETGPFVFAGHSFGGLLAANIAYRYPEKTAAVALLDATPLDVIFYGADSAGLSGFVAQSRRQGFLNAFGFYRQPIPDTAAQEQGPSYVNTLPALPAIMSLARGKGQAFATASVFEELTAEGLRDRVFDIAVFDGMLGDTPLYLVAPMDDPSTQPYAEMVLGVGDDADRFAAMLRATRERYMRASSNAHRVIAPEGSGHVFPDTHPDFVADTVRQIQEDLREASGNTSNDLSWTGPYGGVPPLDVLTPAALDRILAEVVAGYRSTVQKVLQAGGSPTFENTVLALDRAAEPLRQWEAVLAVFTTTARTPEIAELAKRHTASISAARDEVNQNKALFESIASIDEELLSDDAQRLIEVYLKTMRRSGAQLPAAQQDRLREINSELATLRQSFVGKVSAEEQNSVVIVRNRSRLAGLKDSQIASAKSAAVARNEGDVWAIQLQRPFVWPVLRRVHDRELREEVWRAWVSRGSNVNEYDTRETISRILELRGEKARLMGYENFAQWQTSQRMIGTPDAAMALLQDAIRAVKPTTLSQIEELTELAGDELAGDALRPWDFLYYHERQRAQDFAVDMDEVQSYLALENVVRAMFWSAGELYGLQFKERSDIPVVHNSVRTFEVTRAGRIVGVLYLDLFSREGKGPASWASQYRSFAQLEGPAENPQIPLVALHSAVTPAASEQVYVPWERANVIFHEFGHTLQTLQNIAPYPSIGPLSLPWDFIEAPSLLHERWFMDRRLLKRFMKNADGVVLPDGMVDRLEASLRAERPITLTLNFLASALVDMHLHRIADGRKLDVVAEETAIIEDLDLPEAIDLAMYAPHAFHTFTAQYAAGLYTYLWSNLIAADASSAFREAPGGMWDPKIASAWRALLENANRSPIEETWHAFRGRAPQARFLYEAYGLEP